uniref:hypothetical protein n=1 Tax=Thaumasiovibrio occultus TaxID=1891184 RepID=UPI000B34D3C4|nr:hypothetical protein [Thaumasiovibrio occultus]
MEFETLIKQKYGFSVYERKTLHTDGKQSRASYQIRDTHGKVIEQFEHISLVFKYLEEELATPV